MGPFFKAARICGFCGDRGEPPGQSAAVLAVRVPAVLRGAAGASPKITRDPLGADARERRMRPSDGRFGPDFRAH